MMKQANENGDGGQGDGVSRENHTYLQAGLATGYLCRRTEEELNTIAAATSFLVTQSNLAGWMGKFLLSKSSRGVLHGPKHLSQVRRAATEGYALPAAEETVHVHTRRHLSLKARRAIARAQRKRWAKFHKTQGKPKLGRPALSLAEKRDRDRVSKQMERMTKAASSHSAGGKAYWAKMTDAQRTREMKRRAKLRKATMAAKKATPKNNHAKNPALANFWAKMTPAQRSMEMIRRRQVAAAKANGAASAVA